MERIEAIVTGRVQVVMYRDFTTRKARRLGIVGEVENLPDGTVRVIAEGEKGALEKLIQKLHKGSILSRVDSVTVSWMPATNTYHSFDITFR